MFGMLALGIFSVFVFSGIFGKEGKSGSSSEGGFGSKILGFLGVKSLSDIFSGSVSTSSSSSKDDDNEDDNGDNKSDGDVDFNKSLALIQQQIDSEKDENKKNKLEKDYNEMLSCVYDEKGNKLSQEQIQKNLESKPEFKKNLEKQALIAAKDEETSKKFKENISKIDDIQAIKAGEKAVIAHLEVVKNKKLEETKDDEEKKKRIEAEYDALISTHKSNIESIEKTAKEIEELNKEKTALNAEDAVKKEIEKCGKINWDDSPYNKGDLDLEDEEDEKKKAAEEFLKSKGVNPEIYKKYESVKLTLDKGEKIEDNEDLKKAAEEEVKKKKEEIDKQISDKNKEIKNTIKSQEPEKKKEPEKKDENSFEDEDGNTYKIDGDKYIKTDEKGKKTEINKEEFEKAKEKAVDDKKDGDERTDNDDDLEDDEVDDKGNSTGKKDPRKIYKRRTYKRGDKTFKTKSYYDKKGNSITSEEFKKKLANFENSNKQKDEKFNISNFLKDKLIVERFYPRDITNYLQDNLR